MGQIVKVDGIDRELVKVKSNDPAGYYTTLRERMGVGDVEYVEKVEVSEIEEYFEKPINQPIEPEKKWEPKKRAKE